MREGYTQSGWDEGGDMDASGSRDTVALTLYPVFERARLEKLAPCLIECVETCMGSLMGFFRVPQREEVPHRGVD